MMRISDVGPGPFRSLKIFGLVAWQLRYDLVAVVIVAVIMSALAKWPAFQSAAPVVPLLGVVVSIFIGFRNSSAYTRWWEARTLWGSMIGNSRAVGNALVAVGNASAEMAVIEDRMRRRQARHAWQVAADLRGIPVSQAVVQLTPEDPADATAANLLTLQAADTRDLRMANIIDAQGRVVLTNLNTAQTAAVGGLERIRNQPIPPYYSMFVRLLAWVFAIMVCTRLDAGGHYGAAGMVVSISSKIPWTTAFSLSPWIVSVSRSPLTFSARPTRWRSPGKAPVARWIRWRDNRVGRSCREVSVETAVRPSSCRGGRDDGDGLG